jgi:LacI family transcriptional regulator
LDEIIHHNRLDTIGFVGDYHHCLSFLQRYEGFTDVIEKYKFPAYHGYSIIDKDILFADDSWLYAQLSSIHIPDLFFCANDIIATRIITCLSRMGLYVPKNVLVCSFDGTPALASINPNLTTVIIPSKEMGQLAANVITQRLSSSQVTKCVFSLNTQIYYNNSTNSI